MHVVSIGNVVLFI
jgi:hypothetical protein